MAHADRFSNHPLQTHDELQQKRFFFFSLGFHFLALLFMVAREMIAPSEPKVYIPSMRVDLVALPDHKVNETPKISIESQKTETEKKLVEKDEKKIEIKADDAIAISKKPTKDQDRMKAALDRIKALAKVQEDEPPPTRDQIRGNQISKGSAVTGEAKNSAETSYFDLVLDRVRARWELPRWLQEKPLSARVALKIDRDGQIKSIEFIQTSGEDRYDQEVRRAIQAAAPFPNPPTTMVSELSTSGILLGFPI